MMPDDDLERFKLTPVERDAWTRPARRRTRADARAKGTPPVAG